MANPRIDSRDVLDPNARTKAPFPGRVVGHFRPTGPNPWDDFEYVSEDGGEIEVLAGLKVEAEPPPLARVRLRRQGQVQVVEWRPSPEEEAERTRSGRSLFEEFTARYLAAYNSPPAWGLAALVRKKLKEGGSGGD